MRFKNWLVSQNAVLLSLVLAVCCYGLTSPLAALPIWNIWTHIFVRMLVCEICIIAIVRTFPAWSDFTNPKELAAILFCSLTSPLFVLGAKLGSPNVAIILAAMASIWGALFNTLYYKEPPAPGFWFRQGLATLGFLDIGWNSLDRIGPLPLVIGLLNGIFYGIWMVLHSRRPEKAPATDVVGGFGIDVVAIGIGALLFSDNPLKNIADSKSWFVVPFAGMLVGLAFLVITRASRILPKHMVPTILLISTAEAPIGIVWAWILLRQKPFPYEIRGGALILVAIIWETLANRKKQEVSN